jgi:MFS family permease
MSGFRPTRGHVIVFMLFLFQTLNFFDKLVFGLSAVPIMKELNISPRIFGLIGSAFFVLFSLTGTLVGLFVIGRVRTKWVIATLAVVWMLSQIPVFFTSSFLVIALCRIALGAGEGPGLPTALHAVYDWFPPDRRSVPSACVLQGISAGFLIGAPLLTFVIQHYGWRYGFLTCAGLGLVWTLGWLAIGGEGPYEAAAPVAASSGARVPERMLWLDPTVIGITIMSFMSYWVVGMSAIWLPPFLQVALGYTPYAVGWIISGVFAFQSPLLLIGSGLCQTLQVRGFSGRATYAHTSTAALAISGAALMASLSVSGALQLVLIGVAFAAPSLTTVFGPVALAAVAPAAQRGKLVVVIYSANALAALVSNAATGWVVSAGDTPQAGYAHAMALAAGMLLVGAASSHLLMFPDRTRQRYARALAAPSSLPISNL